MSVGVPTSYTQHNEWGAWRYIAQLLGDTSDDWVVYTPSDCVAIDMLQDWAHALVQRAGVVCVAMCGEGQWHYGTHLCACVMIHVCVHAWCFALCLYVLACVCMPISAIVCADAFVVHIHTYCTVHCCGASPHTHNELHFASPDADEHTHISIANASLASTLYSTGTSLGLGDLLESVMHSVVILRACEWSVWFIGELVRRGESNDPGLEHWFQTVMLQRHISVLDSGVIFHPNPTRASHVGEDTAAAVQASGAALVSLRAIQGRLRCMSL